MSESSRVNYQQVSSVALDMISSGVKPTVRGVMKVTGGKTETVSGLLRDFFDKRDAEVSKMADELGSSNIASLLASEIQIVVDRKTNSLSEIVERQKIQLAEMVELLDEKELACQHRIELAEAQSKSAIDDATIKIANANERSDKAESASKIAQQELEKVKSEAEALVLAAEQKSITLIEAAKNEANALVNAANKQIDKAESEAASLRQQVKTLSVDQAKNEIEKAQYEQAKQTVNQLQIDIAESKTLIVKLQTQETAFLKDNERLERDLIEAKDKADKFSQAQSQLVELQKQLSQAQTELSQSQREIASLSQALSKSK